MGYARQFYSAPGVTLIRCDVDRLTLPQWLRPTRAASSKLRPMVFIAALVVGLVILVGSMLLDGVFDVFDADFGGSGLFSATSLGGFITGLGIGGMLGDSLGLPVVVSTLIGVAVGVGLGWVAVVVYRALKRSEVTQEEFSTQSIVGSRGVITAGTSASEQQGLVRVSYLGAPRTIGFIADEPLATGTEVEVTACLSDNVVKVIDQR